MTARRVVIAGASGLIGRALSAALRRQGDGVVQLVRRPARTEDECAWDPAAGELAPAALAGADVVVNLAGANVGEGRWTTRRRTELLASRVDSTRTLVRAMAAASERPRVLICASATGIYGDRGDEMLTEAATSGGGFLAEVCRTWEREALAAQAIGVRTVCTRFGVVLTPSGGALAKLLPLFRFGLGGRIGGGAQWMSWIGLDDAVAAIEHVMAHPDYLGPVNVVAPDAVTNATFTAELAGTLRRPAVLPVPAAVLRVIFGRMADETLLASARVVPEKLLAGGFVFGAPHLGSCLRGIVTDRRKI